MKDPKTTKSMIHGLSDMRSCFLSGNSPGEPRGEPGFSLLRSFSGPLRIPCKLGFDCFEAWIFVLCLASEAGYSIVGLSSQLRGMLWIAMVTSHKSLLLVCGTVYMHLSP